MASFSQYLPIAEGGGGEKERGRERERKREEGREEKRERGSKEERVSVVFCSLSHLYKDTNSTFKISPMVTQSHIHVHILFSHIITLHHK